MGTFWAHGAFSFFARFWQVFINKKKYNFNQVVESILELERIPLLVVLPLENPLDPLHTVHSSLKGITDESTVIFRLDNLDDGKEFNDYIRNHSINKPLDKYTNIVYTNSNTLTKPLIASNWRPKAVLLMNSIRLNAKMETYINQCDLVIHYDTDMSQFARFRSGLEEL